MKYLTLVQFIDNNRKLIYQFVELMLKKVLVDYEKRFYNKDSEAIKNFILVLQKIEISNKGLLNNDEINIDNILKDMKFLLETLRIINKKYN